MIFAMRIAHYVQFTTAIILICALTVSYSNPTAVGVPCESNIPTSQFSPIVADLPTNRISGHTVQESRSFQVSPSPPHLLDPLVYFGHMSNRQPTCCPQACTKQLYSNCHNIGLTPNFTYKNSLQTYNTLKYKNRFNATPFLKGMFLPCTYRFSALTEAMANLDLPPASPGSLVEIHANSLPDLSFYNFIDTRAIPFEDEQSAEVISTGSFIPGSHLRYVTTHTHGRPSLSNTSVFARPAKNLASDLNGRSSQRPPGRGSSFPRAGRPSPRGRGRRSPSPQSSTPSPVSAAFLATKINQAIGDIQSSSKLITPNQIIFKAFDRNGLPDDTLLQQSGPTTFFLHLDATNNPEDVAALCSNRPLHFPTPVTQELGL